MQEILTLKESLRNALELYIKKHPQLSMRAIAKKSGVNRYFLSKLLDTKDPTLSLDLNQVLILSKYISNRESITEVIDSSNQNIKEVLRQVFAVDYEENRKIIASEIYEKVDINDKYTYFVLVLATYDLGTKHEFIQKILGERGENVLKELLDQKILVKKDGRIKLRKGNDFTYDFKVMIQRIPDYLGYYRQERALKKENFLHVISEGINITALHEIQKIHASAYKQISKIISKKENRGDIPMFSMSCMDRLIESVDKK